MPSFCLFAQVARGLPVVDFLAQAFLYEGNARGAIDSMAQVSDFYEQMCQVASTAALSLILPRAVIRIIPSSQQRFAPLPDPPPEDASSQVKMAYKLRTALGKAIR
jgi:hypothetical protein